MNVSIEINSPSECPYRNDDYDDECRYPKTYSMECESKYNFPKGCPLVDLFNEQNDIKTEIIYYCVDLDYGYGVFVKEKLYRIDKSGNMIRIPG